MDKETLKKFYKQNRNFIFPILVGIASLILIILVIYPQISSLITNNGSLGQTVTKTKFLEVKAAELQGLNDTELQKDVNIALSALPEGRDYLGVITIIQNILSQSGFRLQSLEFIPAEQSRELAYSVKLEITGPRDSLNLVLTDIESSYRPMKVASIETNLSASNNTEAIVTVNVFYAPLPTTLGSVEAPLPTLTDRDKELVTKLSGFVADVPEETGNVNIPRGKLDPFE